MSRIMVLVQVLSWVTTCHINNLNILHNCTLYIMQPWFWYLHIKHCCDLDLYHVYTQANMYMFVCIPLNHFQSGWYVPTHSYNWSPFWVKGHKADTPSSKHTYTLHLVDSDKIGRQLNMAANSKCHLPDAFMVIHDGMWRKTRVN